MHYFTDKLADLCAAENETLRRCSVIGDVTLDDYTSLQAEKVLHNNRIEPLRDPGDFIKETAEYVKARLGGDAAAEVAEALSHRTIDTADHHGSLFCAQTMQGDLLFGEILRKLGYNGRYIPIHASGQVELGSSTYARGISLFAARGAKKDLPIFPYKDNDRMTLFASSWDMQLLKRLRSQYINKETDPSIRSALEDICSEVLEDEECLSASRLSDQALIAGAGLSEFIFRDDNSPIIVYSEIEAIVRPLLVAELSEESSIIRRMLTDPEMRRCLQEIKTKAGLPISCLLMRTSDDRGRKIFLDLTETGFIGKDWHGEILSYSSDPDDVSRLLEEGKIFPGLFTMALLTAFERGITLMGGVFQSVYLQEWQQCLVKLLHMSGMDKIAERFGSYICDGHVCGPMYALYDSHGFAVPAGPVEVRAKYPSWDNIRQMMKQTRLKDSYRIGIHEMYCDLYYPSSRIENWYDTASEELRRRYPDNLI